MPRLTEAAFNKYHNLTQPPPGGAESSGAGNNEQQGSEMRFRRSGFIDSYTNGQEFDARGRPAKQETSMHVDFAPETIKQYSNWLGTYADRLRWIRDNSPVFWDSEINQENRTLFEQIKNDEGVGEDGSVASQEKIAKFLKTSEGLMKTTKLLTFNTELRFNTLGLRLDYASPQDPDARGILKKGYDVGRGGANAIRENWASSKKTTAASALVGAVGAGYKAAELMNQYTDRPAWIGAAVGAAGGAFAGSAFGPRVLSRMRSLRAGDPIPTVKDPLVFEHIRQSPELKAYVENVLELNVDSFHVDNTSGEVVPLNTDHDKAHVRKIEKQASDDFRTVQAFNKALGAEATTGRQLIFKDTFTTTIGGEQMDLDKISQHKFKEKLRSLPDKWGQAAGDPCYLKADCTVGTTVRADAEAAVAAGTPGEAQVENARNQARDAALDRRKAAGKNRQITNDVTAAADRAANAERERIIRETLTEQVWNDPEDADNYFDRSDPDQVEKRQLEMMALYDRAEFEAGVELTAQKIRDTQVQEAKDEFTADSTYISSKETALGEEGALTRAQKQEHEDKKDKIGERVKEVEEDSTVYDAQRETEKTVQEAEEVFYQEFTDPDMDSAEKRVSDMLDTNDPGSIRARRIDLEGKIDAEYKALLKGKFGDPPNYSGYDREEIAIAQTEFHKAARGGVLGAEVAQLAKDEEKLTSERSRLRELRQSINQKKREVEQSDASRNIEELQHELHSSMNEIVGWGEPTLTQTELATLSYDELIQRINELYKNDPTKGWAEGSNKDSDKRQKLLHAMLEARGHAEETRRNEPGSDFEGRKTRYDVIGPDGYWNLSDMQLRTLPRDELLNILREKERRFGVVGPKIQESVLLDMIDSAKDYAQEKVEIRENETEKLKTELERQKESERVAGEGVASTNKERKESIGDIQRVLKRATDNDSIFGKTNEISEHVDDFTNTFSVPTKDSARGKEYTDEERNYGAPEGYYQWLQFITNYQQGISSTGEAENAISMDRPEVFNKVRAIIPQEMLASALDTQLELGVSGKITLEKAFEAIKTRGTFSQSQAFEVVRDIMRTLNQEAKTL